MLYPDWSELKDSLVASRGIFPDFPMIYEDMPTFMGLPYVQDPEGLEGVDVAIIGAPYVVGFGDGYAGVDKKEWLFGPKRVRQQSVKYSSGWIQEFDIDVFEHLKVVDFGDADISDEIIANPTANNILKAQKAVEDKVNQCLERGVTPIVIGQNSPCGSYAVAKPVAERAKGDVGVVSIDTHWDIKPIDENTWDPRIAGHACWKSKMYEFHDNMKQKNLIEIGERGMRAEKDRIKYFLDQGTHFWPTWRLRKEGIEALCEDIKHAYDGTDAVYVHYDMDVLGGDIVGTLAEPMPMFDYEVLMLSYEVGYRGFDALSFICIPPGSALRYRLIVYIIMYMLAGRVKGELDRNENK